METNQAPATPVEATTEGLTVIKPVNMSLTRHSIIKLSHMEAGVLTGGLTDNAHLNGFMSFTINIGDGMPMSGKLDTKSTAGKAVRLHCHENVRKWARHFIHLQEKIVPEITLTITEGNIRITADEALVAKANALYESGSEDRSF